MREPRMHVASGVLPAVLTPMRGDCSPDVQLLAQHCRRLLEAGCSGLVLLGTTGEATSLTADERQMILEGVLACGIPSDKLIVGTGCCATGDTVALTKHALASGVTRALVLPPFYYKKVSDEGLFDAFAATIEQIGDARLRIFLYLIPQMSGIETGVDLVERLQQRFPGIIAGLKDSSGVWPSTEVLCRRLGGKIDVMVGTEALMLRAMAAGASGCITAMGNVAAPSIVELFQKRHDARATKLEEAVNAKRKAFERFPLIAALKACLAAATGESSWRNVRPPLRPLSAEEGQRLASLLAKS